ncbi:hypothetical protein BB170200_03654 [Mycobacterium marinum]|nr:hypothetical protein BB170200_03654 [Mycobacterium marinum]
MLHRQHRLDETGDSGRCLGVAEVGLDGADEQRRFLGTTAAQHRAQGARLDRVAQQCSGPVRFDVVDLAGLHPRVRVGRTEHGLLRGRVGSHQTVGATVLVDRRTADHCEHSIAVLLRIGQPLEHHHPGTFTTDETVGGRVEGATVAGWRQCADLIESAKHRRRQQQIHPGGDRQVRVLHAKALAGEMNRHQRRRASGVNCHRRATQVKEVGEAVGDDAHRAAGVAPAIDLSEVGGSDGAVFTQT